MVDMPDETDHEDSVVNDVFTILDWIDEAEAEEQVNRLTDEEPEEDDEEVMPWDPMHDWPSDGDEGDDGDE